MYILDSRGLRWILIFDGSCEHRSEIWGPLKEVEFQKQLNDYFFSRTILHEVSYSNSLLVSLLVSNRNLPQVSVFCLLIVRPIIILARKTGMQKVYICCSGVCVNALKI
jgi:hypothetical protein